MLIQHKGRKIPEINVNTYKITKDEMNNNKINIIRENAHYFNKFYYYMFIRQCLIAENKHIRK